MGPTPTSRAAGARAYARAAGPANIDLRLDANEGPLTLLDRIGIDRIDAPLLRDAARRYPDVAALEDQLSRRLNVDRSRLAVTAGGDDALCRICQAVLEPGRAAIASTPTFEMIPRYVRLAGATLIERPWMDGPFPTDQFASAITDQTAAIFVVTPNNPTGGIAGADDLRELSRRAHGALLVVDLAYTEFADHDLTDAALSLPNAVIVRTLSKAWGLAGLRIGYAIGSAEVISWLRAVGQPYAVSGPSAVIAGWAIAELEPQMKQAVERVRLERTALSARLRQSGARVLDAHGNFVLARFAEPDRFVGGLARRGIAVRGFGTRPGLEEWVRITCPGEPGLFDRLLRAVEEVS